MWLRYSCARMRSVPNLATPPTAPRLAAVTSAPTAMVAQPGSSKQQLSSRTSLAARTLAALAPQDAGALVSLVEFAADLGRRAGFVAGSMCTGGHVACLTS